MFGTLTTHGRLARSRLAQLSKLTPIQINHSLAVLIQQRLAFWYTDPITDITYYEASLGGAYELIRTGKHIQLIKDRFGVFASDILTNYLLLGHIRVRDLEDAYNLSRDGTTAGNANGHDNPLKAIRTTDQEPTLDLLHSTICDLLQHCILSPVHESHFRSPADNRNEAESFVRATCDFTSGTKAKQNAEFEQKVQDTLEGWRTGIEATKRILKNHSTQAGKKRRLGASATDDHQQKRVKLANGFTAVNFPEVSCGEGQGALLDVSEIPSS